MRPDIRILEIRSDVHHRYARTDVYSVVVNPAEESQEVIFKTVLPDEAFVSSFAITVGGRVYPARIEGREEARAEYQQAVRAGRTAAHVQQSARHAHLFTVALHVAARDKAAFNLTYEQLLAREQGRYRLRLMLDPGQVVQRLLVEARVRDSAPLTLVRVAKLRAADNEVDDAAEGPDDPLATVKRLAPGEALVRWEPDGEAQRRLASGDGVRGLLEIQYDVEHTDTSQLLLSESGYFAHFFSLPESHPLMPKHVIFVIDVGHSMHDSKLQQLQVKEALSAILSELREGDAFSLVTFSSEARVWVRGLGFVAATEGRRNTVVAATSDMVLEAQEVVAQLQPQTTSESRLLSALLAAQRAVREGRESAMDGAPLQPLILLLASGQEMSERQKLLHAVTAATSDPATCAPLYSLAFGCDADFHLLKQLSLRGKGFARKIYEAADAALQLRNLYRRVASPLLADVTFHYADGQVEESSLTQAAFPVLLAGAELAVAGVGVGEGEGVGVGEGVGAGLRATVRGAARGRAPLERAAAVQRLEPQQASFVERLWAYLTVRQLLERADGGDPQAKERARELAMRYVFVTPSAGTEFKSEDGKMTFAYGSC